MVSLTSCSRDPGPSKSVVAKQEKTMWPPLPVKGFIVGRPATQDDLTKGDAAFVLGVSAALQIEIPQYAYHIEEQTGKRLAGIIIQAERTPDGKELAAMQPVAGGGYMVAMLSEFKLLGKQPPNED
jgi:hypothetical protein